jgi:5-methylcytosine-specific restriction protein A
MVTARKRLDPTKVTKQHLDRAFADFDSQLRGSGRFKNWERNPKHRYAILSGSRLYPVKTILSLATGVPVRFFSGGEHPGYANDVAGQLDLKVVPLSGTGTGSAPQRNPDWTRDELILALDFYLRHRPNPPGQGSKEVTQLSQTLNQLNARLFGTGIGTQEFRNPNGVYMKLMNFRSLDPEYTQAGKVGLRNRNRLEQVVWDEFSSTPTRCAQVAKAIVQGLEEHFDQEDQSDIDDDFQDAPEGRILTRLHKRRERNRKLVARKKAQTMKSKNALACEACGFDFKKKYGDRGDGFIECHHTKPLETLTAGHRTHLNDLALVCSNCHRMIHRGRPWLSMDQRRNALPKV